MTKKLDPQHFAEHPPLRGIPGLVQDRDGFLIQKLSEAELRSIATKELYVLAVLAMKKRNPDFKLNPGGLQLLVRIVGDELEKRGYRYRSGDTAIMSGGFHR